MSDKLTNELLPCPFCGGAVSLEPTASTRGEILDERKWWGIICRNTINLGGTCAIQIAPSASPGAATARWNRRSRLANAQGEAVAWMVTTSQWPTIQDEEVRFVHHMEGLKQNERWTPLCLCDNPAPMPDSLPDEPTEEMIDSMCKAATDCEWPQDFGKTAIEARQKHARAAYKAMLRAHMGRRRL